jgi:hypothetical protein
MPNVQRTAYESRITLTADEQFYVEGRRIHAVTLPHSADLSEQATLHGSRMMDDGRRLATDTRMRPLEAEHVARDMANPAAADAIRSEINAGLQARQVTLPSEALSQARPIAAQAAKIKPLVQ